MIMSARSSMRANPPTMAPSSAYMVAMQLIELAADGIHVIERVGTVRMARQLCDLPGSEAGEDARGQLTALRLQPRDLVLDVDLGFGGDVPQLLDLGFELGDRLFEIEE